MGWIQMIFVFLGALFRRQAVLFAVLFANTFCTFMREFSPPSPAKTPIQAWHP